MNRYFIPGEGRLGFPRRSYAKLEQVEPPNLEEANEVIFAFDSIDAEWPGFEREQLLGLEDSPDAAARRRRFWERRFGPPGDRIWNGNDPFDDIPIYRIEISVPRFDPIAEKLIEVGDQWLEITLNDREGLEVDVFGGLFMPAVPARLLHPPRPTPKSGVLKQLFDMDDWPDATQSELQASLQLSCNLEHLIAFDVGQGSAIALMCQCGQLVAYFDVGCGVYRNAKTRPSPISFCTHESPPVILSHWDADHWAGATLDRDLLKMTWIAPRQSISQTHKAFGNDILKAGGNILIVPPSLSPLRWGTLGQSCELRRCTGTDRNGSGLALIVHDNRSQRGWLATGDAGYHLIPGPFPQDLAAMVVPHHGADMGSSSVPPTRTNHPYSRLLYSFGPANAHGRTGVRHPTAAATAAHASSGWAHGAWTPPPPAMRLAGQPVLATATHTSIHQQGIIVGWTTPPKTALTGHAAACPDVMPITQN